MLNKKQLEDANRCEWNCGKCDLNILDKRRYRDCTQIVAETALSYSEALKMSKEALKYCKISCCNPAVAVADVAIETIDKLLNDESVD